MARSTSVRTHAAFLRAVNLGATNQVAMPRLRQLAVGLGYTDVATYINSGNLVFGAAGPAARLEREVAQAIQAEFGHRIEVCVRTGDQLDRLVAACPWPDADPSQLTVAFLTGPAPAGAEQRLAEVAAPDEPFRFVGPDVYVWYGRGLGRSKLAAAFSALLGVSATTRTFRTVAKVAELMGRS